MKFDKHIFICMNERINSDRKSCGNEHSLALLQAFKKSIKDHAIDFPIRTQRAGCLDACDTGPTIVVYPEGVYYGNVQVTDVDEIVESHLKNNAPVARLVLKNG
ncbi:MAG: (2Fe-2S) ferredoxin domain-containing protein [Bacteroidetes bacterium]|nr:(2Fe-2S) ferredoxin domain-containing protein [Bacteroidota bacterium]